MFVYDLSVMNLSEYGHTPPRKQQEPSWKAFKNGAKLHPAYHDMKPKATMPSRACND